MKDKRGFYIFSVIAVLLIAVCVWAVMSDDAEGDAVSTERTVAEAAEADVLVDVLAVRNVSHAQVVHEDDQKAAAPEVLDEELFVRSLESGAVPTQDVGERGSLDGALATNYEMHYAPSQFERLPDSPLLVFTDDMIWKDGADGFKANRGALTDQAKHIQEASIALSVSPRVEMGKTTGYRLVEIPEKTLFSKMGMVSGDIVVSINGRLPDMEPMALMFVNMAAGKQGTSTIVVDHRGVERTIHLKAVE